MPPLFKKPIALAFIIAYPDTVVRTATREFSRYVWPLFGIGGRNAVKAGHAALVLVSEKDASISYFDFGRYVTSQDFGRVRSSKTDVELSIPFKAVFSKGRMINIPQLLLFLESQSHNTHGTGRMLVSTNTVIDFDKAVSFITAFQNRGEVPYGAFVKGGSNCARFVCDVLKYIISDSAIRHALSLSQRITPSPVSNVLKGKSESTVYEVFQQRITLYANRFVQKEHFKCLTSKVSQVLRFDGTVLPDTSIFAPSKGQWLGGIGSGAWFVLEETKDSYVLQLNRLNLYGALQSRTFVSTSDADFCIRQPYTILHGTTDAVLFVSQKNKSYSFETFVSVL